MLPENAENFRRNNVKITFFSTDTVQNYMLSWKNLGEI